MSERETMREFIRRQWRKPRLTFPLFEGPDRPLNRERLTQMVLRSASQERDVSQTEIQAQQIQRGLEPAETIPQLVDAIRQDTAGIGACVSSIRFIADARGDIPKSIIEWLDRLAAHADRLESKCALAVDAGRGR